LLRRLLAKWEKPEVRSIAAKIFKDDRPEKSPLFGANGPVSPFGRATIPFPRCRAPAPRRLRREKEILLRRKLGRAGDRC
jgi:hypothetical protein